MSLLNFTSVGPSEIDTVCINHDCQQLPSSLYVRLAPFPRILLKNDTHDFKAWPDLLLAERPRFKSESDFGDYKTET